jgi:hypothetical protein
LLSPGVNITNSTSNTTNSSANINIGSNDPLAKNGTTNETFQNDSMPSSTTIGNTTILVNGTLAPVNDTILSENNTSTIPNQNSSTMNLLPLNQTLFENVTSLANATTIVVEAPSSNNENETVTVLEPIIPKKRNRKKPRSKHNATQPETLTLTLPNNLAAGKNETLEMISTRSDAVNVSTVTTGLTNGTTTTTNSSLASPDDIFPESNSTMVVNASATLINIASISPGNADGVNATNATDLSLPTTAKVGNLRGKKVKETERR